MKSLALIAAVVVSAFIGAPFAGCAPSTVDGGPGRPDNDGDGNEGEGEGEGEGEEGEEGEGEGDVIGPGGDGDVCSVNADCGAGLRCGCTEEAGCACEPGARGTGDNGVDRCETGDDCKSALCVEDADDGFTCSDVCVDDVDCEARLPRCVDIAFVGRICVRESSP